MHTHSKEQQGLRLRHWVIMLVWGAMVMVAARSWADGSGKQPLPPVSAAPPPVSTPSEAACQGAGDPAGTVSAVTGAVFVQSPGEAPRALACDDVVRACDRLLSSDAGTVAMIVDDVYVQLAENSVVTLESSEAQFFVHTGRVRVIDTRVGEAAHFTLASPLFRSQGLRSDAEISVREEIQTGELSARLCNFGEAMTASAQDRVQSIAPGSCMTAEDGLLSMEAAGDGPTIALEAAMACDFEVAGIADRFLPSDVAAPPLALSNFPPVGPPSGPPRVACDDPGSGCGGGPPPAVTPIFLDPDPDVGGGFPGASRP